MPPGFLCGSSNRGGRRSPCGCSAATRRQITLALHADQRSRYCTHNASPGRSPVGYGGRPWTAPRSQRGGWRCQCSPL
jgi:hypothetical protein